MALPLPNACVERYNPGNGSYGELFLCQRSFTAEESVKHFIKRKLYTTHLGAEGWELCHADEP